MTTIENKLLCERYFFYIFYCVCVCVIFKNYYYEVKQMIAPAFINIQIYFRYIDIYVTTGNKKSVSWQLVAVVKWL